MAQSPAHRFGQIIGDLLEAAVFDPLQGIATELGLYLDYKHLRPARKGKRKVSWKDSKGNDHDLDYVLEAGGSEEVLGRPKAFIETAWRRYTKHSRNKAQEIQGALGPLAETYSEYHPFLGVVLAGVFTAGSLNQLRSHGFKIVYYPYELVVRLFATIKIDARFDEDTTDAEVQRKIDKFRALPEKKKQRLVKNFRNLDSAQFDGFLAALRSSLTRAIEFVYVLPLHGIAQTIATIAEAITVLERYDESSAPQEFSKYELNVRYSNGDEIRGKFQDKASAIAFLRNLERRQLVP